MLWQKPESLPIQDEPEKIRLLIYDWDMRLIMNDEQLQALEQVKQFLEGSEALEAFRDHNKIDYCWASAP